MLACEDATCSPAPPGPGRPGARRALPPLAAAVCERRRRLQDQGLELQAAQVGGNAILLASDQVLESCCICCRRVGMLVCGCRPASPSPPAFPAPLPICTAPQPPLLTLPSQPLPFSIRCLFTLLGHLDYIRTVQVRCAVCAAPAVHAAYSRDLPCTVGRGANQIRCC